MTVVIVVPRHESWIVAGWAFRMLTDAVSPLLTHAEDKYKLEQAGALSILDFDLLDSEQGRRVASAVESAAIELRAQLIAGPQDDPRDAEFADILADLARSLHGLYD
jgi:hypothetical protein